VRKKLWINKKVKDVAIVDSLKMLMLVQQRSTFEFDLIYDDNSHGFYCWLDEGKNIFYFLSENGFGLPIHDKNAPLTSFHETNGVKAKCSGANMIMAFLAVQKLSTEDKLYLCFT
jgi:hypothetical protein